MVQGLLLLRDYYKAEYKKALQDKVNHQRKDLQQRERKLEQETRVLAQHHVCSCMLVTCIYSLRTNSLIDSVMAQIFTKPDPQT